MNPVIVNELSKKYKTNIALENISFEAKKGEIFGIIGPDGAGKTSLLRILAGVIDKTSGNVLMNGVDMDKDPEGIKHHTGYMSQKFNLYPTLTVEENIKFFAGIFGVSAEVYNERVPSLLQATGLAQFSGRQAGKLSGGMKQKLALISTLIHMPDILILDEPTLGVDPVSRRDFWQILQDFSNRGTTILISSSYMDEAELCNNIIILFDGRIILRGNPVDAKKIDDAVIELVPRKEPAMSGDDLQKIKKEVKAAAFQGEKIRILIGRDKADMFKNKYSGKYIINYVSPTIEDVFISRING